jgi:hypothetical protein
MNEAPKIGLNIAVVGGMGSGKTFFIKQQLTKLGGAAYIYDPNEEYTEFKNLYHGTMRVKDFSRIVNERSKKSVNIFEEATAFVTHNAKDENVIDLLTRKRHKRVINIFVFHSVNSLPAYIFSFLNVLVLFPTNDREDLVVKKYESNPNILKAYYRAQNAPKYQPTTLKLLS